MSGDKARIEYLEDEISHMHNLICALQGVAWHFCQATLEGDHARNRDALVGLGDALEARAKAALGMCGD